MPKEGPTPAAPPTKWMHERKEQLEGERDKGIALLRSLAADEQTIKEEIVRVRAEVHQVVGAITVLGELLASSVLNPEERPARPKPMPGV